MICIEIETNLERPIFPKPFDLRTSVTVKTLGASPISPPTFQKAQLQYIEGLVGSNVATDLGDYVNAIRYEPMVHIKTTYSNIDLGTWA